MGHPEGSALCGILRAFASDREVLRFPAELLRSHCPSAFRGHLRAVAALPFVAPGVISPQQLQLQTAGGLHH